MRIQNGVSIVLSSLLVISTNVFSADTTPTPSPATTQTQTPVENKTGISAANLDKLTKFVESIGLTYNLSGDKLDVNVDQTKLLSVIPKLSEQDLIPKVEPADLKSIPLTVSVYAVDVSLTISILTGLYAKNANLDKVHVTTYVLPTDSQIKQACFSFDFTRSQYDKIDMDKTSTNDFIAKTPGFSFAEWCKTNLDKESKASSDTTTTKPAS